MPFIKLLELVNIVTNNEKTYLHIKLISDHEIELYWEIDCDTAVSLTSIFESNGLHKYRLSLNANHNIINDCLVSSLVKTFRDISEPINFKCSDEYATNLESIRTCQNDMELIYLPFISTHLPVINQSPILIEEDIDIHPDVAIIKKRKSATFSWVATIIAIMITVVIIFSHQFLDKAKIDNAFVIAAQPNTHNYITPVYSTMSKSVAKPLPNKAVIADETTSSNFHSITIPDDGITYSIPEGNVALTFDDGPSKYTVEITNILKEHNVGGSFFFLGVNAKKYPESVRYVLDNGYTIGNHTMNHFDMTSLTIAEQEKELIQSANIIEDITNTKLNLFRPPYGAIDKQVTDLVKSHEYKIVHWNSDPKDWKTLDADKIVNYVREHKASGSIIILHETAAVVEALPLLIEYLQDQNLNLVNLQ